MRTAGSRVLNKSLEGKLTDFGVEEELKTMFDAMDDNQDGFLGATCFMLKCGSMRTMDPSQKM